MSYYCVPKSLIRAMMMVLGFAFASIVAASAQTCIKSGTEADINRALQGASSASISVKPRWPSIWFIPVGRPPRATDAFSLTTTPGKTVSSLSLPKNGNMHVLAITEVK